LALVSLFGIDKNYDIKQLLKGVDFILNEGEKVASYWTKWLWKIYSYENYIRTNRTD